MKETTIKALMIEPKKAPCKCTLTNELSELQKAVSIGAENVGLIEIVNLSPDVCLLCNEEGKLIGLEGNRRLGNDILVGVFYIMSENEEGELISLTERKIKRYTELFWEPETFDRAQIEDTITCHIY